MRALFVTVVVATLSSCKTEHSNISEVKADSQGLSKSTQNGSVTISGIYRGKKVQIHKFKNAGRCFTQGTYDKKSFELEVYNQAGETNINGELPEEIENILTGYNYKPFTCPFFGM